MKRYLTLLAACCLLTAAGPALAEQEVLLPQSRYAVNVPDEMLFSAPGETDQGVAAYVSETLEMDYTAYPREEAAGMADTLQETAEKLSEAGREAEVRLICGIEMICFRHTDEADGAPCIGYIFEENGWIIEIDFWYATAGAGAKTKEIMESIHPVV